MLNQTMKHHTAMMFPRVLKIVQECGAMCEHMVSHFLCMPDARSRIHQIQLLRDCATICETLSCYIARRSVFAKAAANLCAYICEACGNECAKFADQESQMCSRMCLKCAQECRTFAA
ncbi:hypothetical protein M2277_005755 [Paenibacillus sp. LBL]|jgi:hypothetical protein|nr:ferredoxin [Paenibacillus sp. FSL R5-808]MDH6675056.1 hypothetical protein [Paenibacillus sp. LBL]OMF70218.1 ferredoxin [Paenibacillus glucanolyticus]